MGDLRYDLEDFVGLKDLRYVGDHDCCASQVLTCAICGRKTNEKNPLTTAAAQAQYGATGVPWRTYNKKRRPGHRIPQGRFCCICNNTFRVEGSALRTHVHVTRCEGN